MYLTQKAIQAIKENGELYGKIADHLGVSPMTMPDKLRRNGSDFTQIGVIELIKKYTGFKQSEILTDSKVVA